jgi:uncharacterized protein YndB with AHSA1/START domain
VARPERAAPELNGLATSRPQGSGAGAQRSEAPPSRRWRNAIGMGSCIRMAATISEHLAVLRSAGLVRMTPVGTSRRYRARPEALNGLHGALEGATKWQSATDIPERALAETQTRPAVLAAVDLPVTPEAAFDAFTDPDRYSRWLQVPVTLRDGAFAATLEWGTEVRGRYELVVRPQLIVMSWDFDDDNVPVPGHLLTAYLRIAPRDAGCRVEVHQLTETSDQSAFMEAAWGMVLGRLKANIEAASRSTAGPAPRPRRPKRPRPTHRPE